jgi:hypothetical protein
MFFLGWLTGIVNRRALKPITSNLLKKNWHQFKQYQCIDNAQCFKEKKTKTNDNKKWDTETSHLFRSQKQG